MTKIKVRPLLLSPDNDDDIEIEKKSRSDHFPKFCLQTSLHGWKYLILDSHLYSRIVWCLILLTFCLLSVIVLQMTINQFQKSTVRTSINTTSASLQDITFPSLYLCNINQVTKSFLTNLIVDQINPATNRDAAQNLFDEFMNGLDDNRGETKNEKLLNQMIQKLTEIYKWNQSVPFIKFSSHKCETMLLNTEWDLSNSHYFYPAFQGITDFGVCCVMVPHLDFVNNETKDLPPDQYTAQHFFDIPKGTKNGVNKGLKLIVDVESYDYAYFPRASRGFKIALADARDKAVINQNGNYLPTGSETLVAITPTMIETSVSVLNRFDPDIRGCYLDEEFDFLTLKRSDRFRYSINNCLYEAVINSINSECNCMPTFVVRTKTERNETQNLPICRGSNLTCAIMWLNRMGREENPDMTFAYNTDKKLLKCRQRCKLQTEVMTPSSSSYPIIETFTSRKDYCLILQKLAIHVCPDKVKRAILDAVYGQIATCADVQRAHDQQGLCKNTIVVDGSLLKSNEHLTNMLLKYAKDNVAVVKLFIKDPYYTHIVRGEQMSIVELIATAGGLLSLFLGLSFVSIFEMVYHGGGSAFNFCFKAFCRSNTLK